MTSAFHCAAICWTLVLASTAAAAQQPPPTSEPARQIVPATEAATGPLTRAAIEAQLEVAARPETAERLAAFKRNLYEALLKKGFNGQDAMQIVIATPPPAPLAMR
jgi:predicted amidohydrolase YtcJ